MSTPLNDFANGGAAAAPTQTHHQQSTANQPPELQSLLLPSLECSLCLSLICEPISTGCGHSFCRVCLVKSLRRHKKRCPSCREVCHIMAENAAENVMIKSMAMLLDQETYLARLEEAKQEKASWTTLYPIFYYNSTIFPQNILSLHLFEPRYKLMMQRVVNTTNAFAYVPNFNNYHAQLGDIALVAKVKEVEFLADGRCLLEATIVSRNKIVDHYVEDGTQGLHFCRVETFKDDAIPADQRAIVEQLSQSCHAVVTRLLDYVGNHRAIEGQYGAMPNIQDYEAFSLWLASLSPMSTSQKMELLRSTHTIQRLQRCQESIERYLERFHITRFATNTAVNAFSSASDAISTAIRGVVGAISGATEGDDESLDDDENANDIEEEEEDQGEMEDDGSDYHDVEEDEVEVNLQQEDDSYEDYRDADEDHDHEEEGNDPNLYA